MRMLVAAARAISPPLLLFLLVVLCWHVAVGALDIKAFILPGPVPVATALWENLLPAEGFAADGRTILPATAITAAGAVGGFLASLFGGTAIALVFSQSPLIRNACYPYAIFLQTVPIVAIAPLIVLWAGYGFQSVVLVAFMISLFPIVTNATAGLTSVERSLVELFALGRATRLQTLWRLRLPNAVPSIVVGARVSAGLSVIGALVGEFTAGAGTRSKGLGYLILNAQGLLKTDLLIASVFASTLLGLAIFGTVNAVGALVLRRWRETHT